METETSGMLIRLRYAFSERVLAYIALFVALVLGCLTFALLSSETFLSDESDLVAILLMVDITTLGVLLIFVGRQVYRLIRERRRRLAGYQLHLRLVTLFGVITVFPAIIIVAFSFFVLDFSLRGWFSDRISTAINESVTVANAYLEEHIQSVEGQILAMANDIKETFNVKMRRLPQGRRRPRGQGVIIHARLPPHVNEHGAEMVCLNHRIIDQHRQPPDQVFQLPDIAGPVPCHERVHGIG